MQCLSRPREVGFALSLSGTSWPRAKNLRRSCVFGSRGKPGGRAGDAHDAAWLTDVFSGDCDWRAIVQQGTSLAEEKLTRRIGLLTNDISICPHSVADSRLFLSQYGILFFVLFWPSVVAFGTDSDALVERRI